MKKSEEENFYSAVTTHLESSEWKSLNLISIPEASATRKQFVEKASQLNWRVKVTEQNVCPVITLPKTWEEYLVHLGKKQRHEIKRKWKNLEEQLHPIFTVVETAENLDQDLADFIQLHKLSSTNKAEFWSEKQTKYFRELIKTAAENNCLKLFFLEISGERAATMLCFDYNNQFYLYNSGFDPSKFAGLSVGNVLTSYTIQQAIELGRSRYDFLRGREEYKLRYGAIPEPIFDLFISR